MSVPEKSRWKATGSGGDPNLAIDDVYATTWVSDASENAWLQIDLGENTTLGGLEVYWGERWPSVYEFEWSLDGKLWSRLCQTRHGEGGQDVFAFPPTLARYVRWLCEDTPAGNAPEIVEINLYDFDHAASVREQGRIAALGYAPIKLPTGQSVTVDLRRARSPLGAFIEWGEAYGTVFSVHLSDDGDSFREVGRILTGDGGSDSFWWRSTTARFLRFTLHEASSPEGAIVNELKLRVLNKDRMPIGELERAAQSGRGELYPQPLLGRQIYWTALGDFDQEEEALFDEFGDIEPRRGSSQLVPLLRVDQRLHGAPGAADLSQSLADGSLPIPSIVWSADDVELHVTALARAGQAVAEYRVANRSATKREAALVLAVRPVQINPYWQHGGHSPINAIAVDGKHLVVNDRVYAAFSQAPHFVTVADFDSGDVARLIDKAPAPTEKSLRSRSGLLSAAGEFNFSLAPGESVAVVAALPMRDGATPDAGLAFSAFREGVVARWRDKLGPRRISVGDREVTDTVAAQTALILVNATRHAFKPGPRNYDRTWIRDGSSQALALLWAGLIEEAKAYVLWYAKRVYDNGMVPPILNVDGTVNKGYGSDIEYDAQGEFVGAAADVYRVTRDEAFLKAVYEPVVRATKFIEELCARTNARHGPESRFFGLIAPSISHEGYSKPSYSYWDDFFALSAWRNCEYLANEMEDTTVAAYARAKGEEFAANLARSVRMTSEGLGKGLIYASADREDVDPTSISIAFEPCRVEDVLPAAYLRATYDLASDRVKRISSPDFEGNYTPYEARNINAFVALGRHEDAYRMLKTVLAGRRPPAWRGWAEVVWSDPRAPDYIGDMPHTWIGAELATAVRRMLLRENGATLELFRAVPDAWWEGEGIALRDLPTGFGLANLTARRSRSQATVELSLSGPAPERIRVRYPRALLARVDGNPVEVRGDVIEVARMRRLEIDF
ncbi:MAG TPA: discoidin domain-containing protein [Roseiarcus sp.]|nr:discoidin domain-containing protein [Roseiarcus sp.]